MDIAFLKGPRNAAIILALALLSVALLPRPAAAEDLPAPPQATAAEAARAAPAGAAALELGQAIAAARQRSGSLKVKRLDMDRAAAAAREAATKGMPQLSLMATGTYMTNPPDGITIKQGSLGFAPAIGSQYPVALPDQDYVIVADPEPTYFKLQASLDQVLWTWGKIAKATEIAKLDSTAAGIAASAEERGLVRDVSKAYFGAVAARDSLALLREAKAIMDGIVRDRQSAFDAGTATRADVLDAAAKAAQLGYQVTRAEESSRTGLDALAFYLGARPEAADLVTPFRESMPAIDESALVRDALGGSTEIAALEVRARQATLGREIREASLMGIPDFSLNMTYELTGQKLPYVNANWTDGWSGDLMVTLGMKVTLFDSLASFHRLDQARAQEGEALAGLDELKRSQGIQIRRLVDAARTGAALVLQERANGELAAERARIAGVALRNESVTRSEEGGARVADISSRLSLVLARLQTETALLDLEYATGTSLPRP